MDFINDFSKVDGKMLIMMVVDWFLKYTSFIIAHTRYLSEITA